MSGAPSIDLITTTLGRVSELERFLESLRGQTHRHFRLIVVDQNDDGRLDELVGANWGFPILRLRSKRGISRGRNRGLAELSSDVVAFPDDDCRYPAALLEGVAQALGSDLALDAVTGRVVDFDGFPEDGSWGDEPMLLDLASVWRGGVSATIFMRAATARRVGSFDERLGLGSDVGPRSGEETDYLVRALKDGARIRYEPWLTVEHRSSTMDETFSTDRGMRDGLSLGYILGKNCIPRRIVARMLVRPLAAIPIRLAQRDLEGVRFQWATLVGRVRGLRVSARDRRAETRRSA